MYVKWHGVIRVLYHFPFNCLFICLSSAQAINASMGVCFAHFYIATFRTEMTWSRDLININLISFYICKVGIIVSVLSIL